MAALRPPMPTQSMPTGPMTTSAFGTQAPKSNSKVDAKCIVETNHSDMVHDIQLDYYGRRLATASSDRTIKIFEIDQIANTHKLQTTLPGHEGPVWQIAWSHPRASKNQLLASASYDGRVIIWMEDDQHQNIWRQYFEYSWHASSVNCVQFAPVEYNILSFACASSDGFVSICTQLSDGTWDERRISESTDGGAHTHPLGALSVSWSPFLKPNSLFNSNSNEKSEQMIVTGGCDQLVKIWCYDDVKFNWNLVGKPLKGHRDMIRCVAWAPSIGLPRSVIASGGQDKKVIIWTKELTDGDDSSNHSDWIMTELPIFNGPVWSVTWSPTGSILGVASGEDGVTLWKEEIDGTWRNVSDVTGTATNDNSITQ